METQATIELTPFGKTQTGETYSAHPSQIKMFEWADAVKNKSLSTKGIPVLYAQGGWRSGKTKASIAIVLECMERYPGLRVLIARKDFNDLRLSTMESWREVRPPIVVRSEDKQEHREEWVNGSQVFFRELKDLEGLAGQEFGIILVSEPYELEEEMYFRLKGRISQKDMPHMLILEGNPPNEGHWLHRIVCGDEKTPADQDLTFIEIPTDENWDNLPDGYRKSIEAAPESWQRKYRLGKWGFTPSGQPVYDLFKEHIHVRPVSILPDRPPIRSWDSGVRHPACLWAQTTARGQLLIQYEWLGMEMGLTQFSQGVVLRTNEFYTAGKIVHDYGDPAMFARSPQTGKSDANVLYESCGVQLTGRQSTHQDRKSLIDSKLSALVDGVPLVLIHPRCRTLIEGLLGGYHYPKRKPEQPFSHKFQIPEKDGFYEHLANCFEYLIINLYGHSTPAVSTFIARKKQRVRRMMSEKKVGVWF